MAIRSLEMLRRAATVSICTMSIGLAATGAAAEPTILTGATLIDGTGKAPIRNATIVIDNGRIVAAGTGSAVKRPANAKTRDLAGKYVIPGLMDLNVHLYADVSGEGMLTYGNRLEEAITEAAQIALKNGVTTVFDTWGPRDELIAVRDKIDAGTLTGSRIYLAGNIIGFDGPLSHEFMNETAQGVLGPSISGPLNSRWVKGVGRELMYMNPDEVRSRVEKYIGDARVDFIKYAASGHINEAFIAFSERTQAEIVDAGHKAKLKVVSHTTSPESLRMAVDAGSDIAVHCAFTGDGLIPRSTMAEMVKRKTVCGTGISTERAYVYATTHPDPQAAIRAPNRTKVERQNIRNLYDAKVMIAMATDAYVHSPILKRSENPDIPDPETHMETAPFTWLQGAIDVGFAPMAALQAATRNVAIAYGVDAELGTVEAGKRADLVVLDRDPFADPANYKAIHFVMKDGAIVDRAALPLNPVMTK